MSSSRFCPCGFFFKIKNPEKRVRNEKNMKKIVKSVVALIATFLVFTGIRVNIVQADDIYDDNGIRFTPLITGPNAGQYRDGIIGNRDRKYDKDVRAFGLYGVMGSYAKDLVIYLRQGESFTIDNPKIPGETITGVNHYISDGSTFNLKDENRGLPLPITISYDDLVERDVFNNEDNVVMPKDRYELFGKETDDIGGFLELNSYYMLNYDGSTFNLDFAKGIYDSFKDRGVQGVPFNIYVRRGETLPLIENLYGQTLAGIGFMRNEYTVTDLYTNSIVYGDIYSPKGSTVMFMLYSSDSSNFDLSNNGQAWEALDFNKVPGVQEKLDQIAAKSKAEEPTTEESSDIDDTDEEEITEETQTEDSSSGPAVAIIGGLLVLSIAGFVLYAANKKKS